MTDGMVRELLADLLDDAARLLRSGPDADAQALALHLAKLEGPHRAAWLKMAPLVCRLGVRPAAQRLVATLTRTENRTP
jgi:hypothetical protein